MRWIKTTRENVYHDMRKELQDEENGQGIHNALQLNRYFILVSLCLKKSQLFLL